jgi:hypothetical protein
MKAIAQIFLFGFVLLSCVFAGTVATAAEKTVEELARAMQEFGRANGGAIPYGNNAAVMMHLEKRGMTIPKNLRSPRGEFLDEQGNPIQFLRRDDSHVMIVLLGEKSGILYPRSISALVEGKPFEAKLAAPPN